MTFCTDAHGPQTMNPTDFGDPLTFLQFDKYWVYDQTPGHLMTFP